MADYASRGVRLLTLPRQEKIHALNEAVRHATREILIFSDANILFDRQALLALAQNLADLEVGGVAGNTIYRTKSGNETSSRGEILYWSYDKCLKQLESHTGSVVSAHGGIYAIRRNLYRPVEDAAVTDDFAISTAVVEQGYRLVFESEALAYEAAVPGARQEFRRKVRLMTRGLRGLILRKALFNPLRYGFYSVVLFSHKLFRRSVPLLLVLLFATSVLLSATDFFYLAAGVCQTLFYVMAGAGYWLRRTWVGQLKFLYVPFFYCMANAAALVALLKLLSGQRVELWQPQRHKA